MKRLLVKFRKIKRMFFLDEDSFDKEYLKKRVNNISEEINTMPLKERFKFMASIREKVIENLLIEQKHELLKSEKAKLKYNEIQDLLNKNLNIN